jgi:hypothetical protein
VDTFETPLCCVCGLSRIYFSHNIACMMVAQQTPSSHTICHTSPVHVEHLKRPTAAGKPDHSVDRCEPCTWV